MHSECLALSVFRFEQSNRKAHGYYRYLANNTFNTAVFYLYPCMEWDWYACYTNFFASSLAKCDE